MGTPFFSVPILKSLYYSKHKVIQVYTQPPQKKNRGQKVSFSAIHEYANEIKVSVRHPLTLNTREEFEYIKKIKPDIVVVVAYGKIIPKSFLDLKNIMFINIHASLLPKWRGAAPIQRAIMNCDSETGISIMRVEPKLDTGPILMKSKIVITKEINYQELSDQMSKLGAKLILEALDIIKSGKTKFISQNDKKATYAKKIEKVESQINWNQEAKNVVAKINALYPNPGAWFELKGSRIKVIKAIEIKAKGAPGEIVNKDFTVACLNNAVQIKELKKEGKNKTSAVEFLKGNKLEIGSNINSDV